MIDNEKKSVDTFFSLQDSETIEFLREQKKKEEMREKNKERAEKFVTSPFVIERLSRYAQTVNTTDNKPSLKFTIEGGSYTDNREVVCCLMDDFWEETNDVYLIVLKYMLAHEFGHINYSDFVIFRDYGLWAERYFLEKHGIKGAGKVATTLLNITEDGRIERAQVNEMPGLIHYIQYVNGFLYENFTEEKMGHVPLHDFLNSALTLSNVGLLPKGYHKLKGTEVEKVIDNSIEKIMKAIESTTASQCMEITKQILLDHEEILVEWMKKDGDFDPTEKLRDLPDFLGQPLMENAPQGPLSPHLIIQSEEGEELGEQHQARRSVNDNLKTNEDLKKEENSIQNALNSILNEIKKDNTAEVQMIEQQMKRHKEEKANQEQEEKQYQLNQHEILGAVGYGFDFIYENEQLNNTDPLPQHLKMGGAKFHKDLLQIFNNKKGYTKTGQYNGRLNVNSLWRMSINEQDVFIKKGEPKESDYVVSILVDNSASMTETVTKHTGGQFDSKVELARNACAVIEEGLRGIIPFKIQRFDASQGNFIRHSEIKGWQDKGKENRSWKATTATGAGNADGYSIKIASEELLKRPERKKILIVLSDGLPSTYNSHREASRHVNDMVTEAREKGIKVVAIRFGSERVLKETSHHYSMMYERDFISCLPQNILKELTKVLKKITK